MSLALMLYKNSLIARRNNLQYDMLNNFSLKRNMSKNLSFSGAFEKEKKLDVESSMNSIQLMAINSELEAINNSKINYFA